VRWVGRCRRRDDVEMRFEEMTNNLTRLEVQLTVRTRSTQRGLLSVVKRAANYPDPSWGDVNVNDSQVSHTTGCMCV